MNFRWMYRPQFGFYVAHTPCMHCYHYCQSPTKHACMHAQQQLCSSASTTSWTGGLALKSLCQPAHPALTAPEPPTHPPSTQPGLPTTRPPHMHKPSTVTGLQQFDPGGTVDHKAQIMHWYGGKIFLTFFAQITSYGFCIICATGQIPPFLLHEGSRHPRMRQYQNGRQRH